jgi:hypothetical protein
MLIGAFIASAAGAVGGGSATIGKEAGRGDGTRLSATAVCWMLGYGRTGGPGRIVCNRCGHSTLATRLA